MASTGINNGNISQIEVGSTVITHLINCTISHSQELREVTTKDSSGGARDYLPGLIGATISGEAYFAEDAAYNYDNLFDAWKTRAAATILYGSGVTGDEEISGSGYVSSLTRTAGNQGEPETTQVEFQLTGAVTSSTA